MIFIILRNSSESSLVSLIFVLINTEAADNKSRSGLIKHLNKSKLPIRTEGYDDEAVIKAILRLFEANMPILIDEEEVLDEEDISKEVAELPKKKGKKKSKDKAHKIDVAEIEGLSKKGKGNKSKKAKGKKSKK